MEKVRLGRTNLMVTKTAFGALPIQRVAPDDARHILRAAYAGGINFFDTARGYSDSEEKIGYALSDVRDNIIIATKTLASDRESFCKDLETSLRNLRTDYVDIIQLHNPPSVPDAQDSNSTYSAAVEAKEKGQARFIGITNHRLTVAREAVESGLFDTLQYPLSPLLSREELALVDTCRERDVGFIAMKGLCGGLFVNVRAAFAFFRQYDSVVPVWGIQRQEELEEFIRLEAAPPVLDDDMRQAIDAEREALSGDFCRGCGYCLPCPAEIPIPMAARMKSLLRRARHELFMSDLWREQMARIRDCTDCGECRERCPYDLDTPRILKEMLEDYEAFCTTQ
ncbi:MAG: aldo/keto reductase [Candidatus Hydrogenedentes bacterium]|nr:aldo/keto reductase [Candidatus Hydrogenedentota bacterium]